MKAKRFLVGLAAFLAACSAADFSDPKQQDFKMQPAGYYVCMMRAHTFGANVRVRLNKQGKVTSGVVFVHSRTHWCIYRSIVNGSYSTSESDIEVFMTVNDGTGSHCPPDQMQQDVLLSMAAGEDSSNVDTGMGSATGECRQMVVDP